MDREKYLPLAPRDLLVLSVLAEGPLHGYGIIKAVEDRSESGVFLDPANLYRVLRRMRRVGWIRETPDPAFGQREGNAPAERSSGEGKAGGRRKTYGITPDGRAVLASELTRLERLLLYARPALAGASNSSDAREEG